MKQINYKKLILPNTPALNTLKVLRGAPISMGRGETPVRLQLTTARFAF